MGLGQCGKEINNCMIFILEANQSCGFSDHLNLFKNPKCLK